MGDALVDGRLIGAGRRQLVEELVAAFETVKSEGARPRLVTLEAPSGWGKTRVVQSFYARLAAQQTSPYWPQFIPGMAGPRPGDEFDGDRKNVCPDLEEDAPSQEALPEFFWWGLTATRRQAGLLPTKSLAQDLDQVLKHSDALERHFKRHASRSQRTQRAARRNARSIAGDVVAGAGGAAADAVVVGVGGAAGLALGPLGVAAGVMTGTAIAGLLRSARNGLAAEPGVRTTSMLGVEQDDRIGPVREALTEFARAGLPLVVVVEDVHTADAVLVELLVGLLTGPPAPILVVATGWPGLLDEDCAPRRLVAEVPADVVLRKRTDVLEGLDQQELSELARQALADRGVDIGDEDALLLAERFTNPLAMKLVARGALGDRLERALQRGRLKEEIGTFPREIADVFKDMWKALPKGLRTALTVAVLSSPAGVPSRRPARILDDSAWDATLIAAAATATPWLAEMLAKDLGPSSAEALLPDVENCLKFQSESYGWAQRVDEWLRTWLEPDQQKVAADEQAALCSEMELGEFYGMLAESSDLSDAVPDERRIAAAQMLVSLAFENVIDWTEKTMQAGDLLLRQLCRQRDVDSLKRVVALVSSMPHTDGEDSFLRRTELGHALAHLGRVEEAVDHFSVLLEDHLCVLGADHLGTLRTRSSWAFLLGRAGRVEEAIGQFRLMLEDKLQVYGADDFDMLTMRSNLAYLLGRAGRVDEAIDQFRLLLEDRARVLGADHLGTLTTRGNLASWLGRSGRLEEAIGQFRLLLEDELRELGTDHPATLATRSNLASWLGESGRTGEAINEFRLLLEDRVRVFGVDHPATLRTRSNLASWLGESGQVEEALGEFRRLLNDQLSVLGADHPGTIGTRSNLASMIARSGRVEEAIGEFRSVIEDQLRTQSRDHPDTLRTRSNLASWLGESGRAGEAIDEFRSLLEDRVRVLGANHPDTLRTRSNLLSWLGESGRLKEAIAEFGILLENQRQVLGAEHPDTLRTLSNMASLLGRSGQAEEAISRFRVLVNERTRVLGTDHPDTLRTHTNLAYWLAVSGRVEETDALVGELDPTGHGALEPG